MQMQMFEERAVLDESQIADALELLNDIELPSNEDNAANVPLGDLLEQIDALSAPAENPIRMIHHLSCTGGTLIAKCIASMPNVLLLNEIDPLSPLPIPSDQPSFTPTDMIALLRQGDRRIGADLIERLFVHDIGFLREEQGRIGRSLVLRDHSHSHFLTGPEIPDRPTLREMLAKHFPVRSVVTVRDPIDSYLSMQKNGWHELFQPSTFEEYCRRYIRFLESYPDVPVIRYEGFVTNPMDTSRRICDALELSYSDQFINLFSMFHFSGDSGRSGDTIAPRQTAKIDDMALHDFFCSHSYHALNCYISTRCHICPN